METLRRYLNQLELPAQSAFAHRCGTTVGYLRKAISAKHRLGVSLAIRLERESAGAVRLEDLRPDVDWCYLRRNAA